MTLARPMADFEVATMTLSILSFKEAVGGPMVLMTDIAGSKWSHSTGIASLYDHVEVMDPIDHRIDTNVFWAAGKIQALSKMRAPVISIDLDAVLLTKLSPLKDLHILHTEPQNWEAYGYNPLWELLYKLTANPGVGVGPTRWQPYNTAIAAFFDQDLLDEYCRVAGRLMLAGSGAGLDSKYRLIIKGSGKDVPVTEMVTAEQLSLCAVADKMEKSVKAITELTFDGDHHPKRNGKAWHLWNSKRFYQQHGRAREAFLTGAMEEIWSHAKAKCSLEMLIQRIAHSTGLPTIRVLDANTGVARWSRAGEWFGPGEEVERL